MLLNDDCTLTVRELFWLLRDAGCLGKTADLALSTLLLSLLPPAYTERLEATKKAATMHAALAAVAVEEVAAGCATDVCPDVIEETERASVMAASSSNHGATCGQDHVAVSVGLPKAAGTVQVAAVDAAEEVEDAICEVKALQIVA